MSWYWFSFSFEGKNQGCCNVEANSEEEGLQKTIDLNIHPKHDDIMVFEIPSPELEVDKLISPKEVANQGFEEIKS